MEKLWVSNMNWRILIALLGLVSVSLALHHNNNHAHKDKEVIRAMNCVATYRSCMDGQDDNALTALECHKQHMFCVNAVEERKFYEVPELAEKNFQHCVNRLFFCHTSRDFSKQQCSIEFKGCAKDFTAKFKTSKKGPFPKKTQALYECVKKFQSDEKGVTNYDDWVGDVCDCILQVEMPFYPNDMLKLGYCFRKFAGCSPATNVDAAGCTRDYSGCLGSLFHVKYQEV